MNIIFHTMCKIRGFFKGRLLTVLKGMVGWGLMSWIFVGQVSAQELKGRVFSADENGDTVAVYMARRRTDIYWGFTV